MNMMKRFGLLLGLGLATMVVCPVKAMAQDDPGQKIIQSMELQQADVRDALRALFRNVNVNYSIAPEVQGTVTVSLKNVLFETALRYILGQVDATYRIESGVYQIIHKEAPPTIGGGQNPNTVLTPVNKVMKRIYIHSADPAFIFRMIHGSTATNISPEISQGRGARSGSAGGGGGGIGGGGGGGNGGIGGGGDFGGGGGGGGGGGIGGGGGGGGGVGGLG